MKMMEIKVAGGYLSYKSGLTFLIGSWEVIFSEPTQNAAFCRQAGMQPIAKNVRWEPSRRPILFLRAEIELPGG